MDGKWLYSGGQVLCNIWRVCDHGCVSSTMDGISLSETLTKNYYLCQQALGLDSRAYNVTCIRGGSHPAWHT